MSGNIGKLVFIDVAPLEAFGWCSCDMECIVVLSTNDEVMMRRRCDHSGARQLILVYSLTLIVGL